MAKARFDVAGVGLNATDTVIRVREFPALGGKEKLLSSSMQAGGQVATALVTCRRLGLSTRYIGKFGDDFAGRFQMASLRREDHSRRISLARLRPEDAQALVAALGDVGFGAPGLSERIYRETEGNPFFLTSILQSLRDGEIQLEARARAAASHGTATPAASPTEVSTALETTTGSPQAAATASAARTPPSG